MWKKLFRTFQGLLFFCCIEQILKFLIAFIWYTEYKEDIKTLKTLCFKKKKINKSKLYKHLKDQTPFQRGSKCSYTTAMECKVTLQDRLY